MSKDVIVEEVRVVREQLLKRYGGLVGWIEHLQEMDRQRTSKAKQRSKNNSATPVRKKRSLT